MSVVKGEGGDMAENEEEFAPLNRSPSQAYNRSKLLYVVSAGAHLVLYNLLVQFLRLKYHGKKETCFDTHSLLVHTSILAFLVASLTSMVLFYDYKPSLPRDCISPFTYLITKIVFSFSALVAHFTILLLLIIG